MSLQHLVLYSCHINNQFIAYQHVHHSLVFGQAILNLVICVRMNVYDEYMCAHEHRYINMQRAQRHVDLSTMSHEP